MSSHSVSSRARSVRSSQLSAAAKTVIENLESRVLLAATVPGFTDLGQANQRTLPANSSVKIDDGRRLAFSAATFKAALPATAKSAAKVVTLPTPDGGTVRLRVTRSTLLASAVAAANPGISTYRAVGVDDPSITATFDLSVNGLHATVLTGNGAWAISPVLEYSRDVSRGTGGYVAYDLGDVAPDEAFVCEVDESHDGHDHDGDHAEDGETAELPTGPTRVTVRLAAAANGEWVALAGGTQASALARIVTNVNYAEALYNREFNIGFSLISGTNLIYTNASTDPYTNSNASLMLSENQTNVDSVIGTANYDIGHVFTTSGGGIASLGVVGQPGAKARGVAGNSPANGTSSQFTFAHEMGHQFNSHHTWNYTGASYADQRSAPNAYEPGPGSTIMSYGGFGFEGDFVPIGSREDYFHARSIEVITDYLVNDVYGAVVGTRTATGNAAPVVNAGANKTIPALTPFELTGSATDNNGNLTYGWEQYDLGDADTTGVDDGDGPLFRSRRFTTSPTRSFPELADVLANRVDNDEFLPQVSRTVDPLTFRLTVRDGVGGVNNDDIDLTVQATGQAFALTSQNATTNWQRGSTQTVTWNVAGTNAAAFDAANVAVLISYDNGATFTPLLASTPNDGSADVVVPAAATLTSGARIKIKPLNNVFYDINNAPISITAANVSAIPGTPDLVAATDTGSSQTDNLTNRDNSTTAKNLQFDVTGTVSGATVSLYSSGTLIGSAVASGTTTTVTTNGTVDLLDGLRSITARQTESGKTQSGDSAALGVTIDTVLPAFVGGAGVFEYATVKPRVVFTFDSQMAFGNSLPTVFKNSPLPSGTVSYNESLSGTTATLTFPGAPNGILPDGRYAASLPLDTYRDLAGNSSVPTTLNFFVLAGDANRDAVVNFNDFLVVQNNFNTNQLNFTKGDFDYNGVIDFNDFLILQNQFGKPI